MIRYAVPGRSWRTPVFPGGSEALAGGGWQAVGREKSVWAKKIAPRMDVENNASPSFQYFREKLRALI